MCFKRHTCFSSHPLPALATAPPPPGCLHQHDQQRPQAASVLTCAQRLPLHRGLQVGGAHVVLSDRHREVEIEHTVPPACGRAGRFRLSVNGRRCKATATVTSSRDWACSATGLQWAACAGSGSQRAQAAARCARCARCRATSLQAVMRRESQSTATTVCRITRWQPLERGGPARVSAAECKHSHLPARSWCPLGIAALHEGQP